MPQTVRIWPSTRSISRGRASAPKIRSPAVADVEVGIQEAVEVIPAEAVVTLEVVAGMRAAEVDIPAVVAEAAATIIRRRLTERRLWRRSPPALADATSRQRRKRASKTSTK